MKPETVADIEGPWQEQDFESSLIERCKRFWNVPVTDISDQALATFIRQRIALPLVVSEAQRRLDSGVFDGSELYDGELAQSLLNLPSPYSPRSLSAITAVDVVLLQGVEVNHVDQYMQNATSAPRVRLDIEAAQLVAELWRQLPVGEQARCHIPSYGLCFYSSDRIICRASVCWECNNIYGDQEGRSFRYEFDAMHSTSMELLRDLQAATAKANIG